MAATSTEAAISDGEDAAVPSSPSVSSPAKPAGVHTPSKSGKPLGYKKAREQSKSLIKELGQTDAYIIFKETVALQRLVLDSAGREIWEYYDTGAKSGSVVILCLPPLAGSAESFFLQILGLSSKGYRVISCNPAPVHTTGAEFCKGMNRFLESLNIASCHILGAGLGGYLALHYCQYKPKRVASLVLVNAFVDNQFFINNAPWFASGGSTSLVPAFMLQRVALSSFAKGPVELRVMRSMDFMVEEVTKRLKNRYLQSRLQMLTATCILQAQKIPIEDRLITVFDSFDDLSRPDGTKEEVLKYFPGSSHACLKDGGEFPYLSRHSEFNMHVQVHMRKHSNVENRSLLADIIPEALPFDIDINLNSPSRSGAVSPVPSSSSSSASSSSTSSAWSAASSSSTDHTTADD